METSGSNKNFTTVEVVDRGPLKITGNIIFKDQKREIDLNAKEVLICRCGQSSTMPFCDKSHACRK